MHKRAFQALKRIFMQVSGLHLAYFDLKKNKFKKFLIFIQNMAEKDLRHA